MAAAFVRSIVEPPPTATARSGKLGSDLISSASLSTSSVFGSEADASKMKTGARLNRGRKTSCSRRALSRTNYGLLDSHSSFFIRSPTPSSEQITAVGKFVFHQGEEFTKAFIFVGTLTIFNFSFYILPAVTIKTDLFCFVELRAYFRLLLKRHGKVWKFEGSERCSSIFSRSLGVSISIVSRSVTMHLME